MASDLNWLAIHRSLPLCWPGFDASRECVCVDERKLMPSGTHTHTSWSINLQMKNEVVGISGRSRLVRQLFAVWRVELTGFPRNPIAAGPIAIPSIHSVCSIGLVSFPSVFFSTSSSHSAIWKRTARRSIVEQTFTSPVGP